MAKFTLKLGKVQVVLVLIVLLALLGVIFFLPESAGLPRNCNDEECIVKAARECKAADYRKESEEITYTVKVGKGKRDSCPIEFKIEEISGLGFLEIEGKEMNCIINTNNFFVKSLFEEEFRHCEGSLADYITEVRETISDIQNKIVEVVELYG